MKVKDFSKENGFLTIPKLNEQEYKEGFQSKIAKTNHARFSKYTLKRTINERKSFMDRKSPNKHSSVKKHEYPIEPAKQVASIIFGRAPETESSFYGNKSEEDASFCSNTISLFPAADPQRTKARIYSLDYSKRIEKNTENGQSVRKVILSLKGRVAQTNRVKELKVKALELKQKEQQIDRSQKKIRELNLKNLNSVVNHIKLRKFRSSERSNKKNQRNNSPNLIKAMEVKPWQLSNEQCQLQPF